MSETWTAKKSKIDINGYANPIHSYRKIVNKKAKRNSGGLIVYIRDSIRKGIKLIKNEIDCLIWIKLDKHFFKIQEDVYLAISYIAPENSRFHQIYDVDIFQKLEMDISEFSSEGVVIVAGDLNSRTRNKTGLYRQ